MSNINLISCSSYLLTKEEINKIVKDNAYTSFDLNFTNLNDIIEEASYMSLFGEQRYIVVKNADIFCASKRKKEDSSEEDEEENKDDSSILINYLNNPNPNTILIFSTYGKCDKKKKIVKMIDERYNYISISDLSYKEIDDRIEKYLKKNKYSFEKGISYYISSSCQNNYDLSMNEVDKIILYLNKPSNITIDLAKKIVSNPLEDSSFKFVEAVMNKDIEESYRILKDLKVLKTSPFMLLIMLSKEIRKIIIYKTLKDKLSDQDLSKKLEFTYSSYYDKFKNRARLFNKQELEKYLIDILDYDYKIKKGKLNENVALDLMILKICK